MLFRSGGADSSAPERAAAAFLDLTGREDVGRIYRSGRPYHEVPFTTTIDGRSVRGVIDCVILDGSRATILEFKTGRPRPEHHAQVEVYRQAVRSALPVSEVEVMVVYARGTAS